MTHVIIRMGDSPSSHIAQPAPLKSELELSSLHLQLTDVTCICLIVGEGNVNLNKANMV